MPPAGDQASKHEPVGSLQSQVITHTFKPRLPKEPQSPLHGSLQQFTGGYAIIFFSSPIFLHLLNLPLSQISMVWFKGKEVSGTISAWFHHQKSSHALRVHLLICFNISKEKDLNCTDHSRSKEEGFEIFFFCNLSCIQSFKMFYSTQSFLNISSEKIGNKELVFLQNSSISPIFSVIWLLEIIRFILSSFEGRSPAKGVDCLITYVLSSV